MLGNTQFEEHCQDYTIKQSCFFYRAVLLQCGGPYNSIEVQSVSSTI